MRVAVRLAAYDDEDEDEEGEESAEEAEEPEPRPRRKIRSGRPLNEPADDEDGLEGPDDAARREFNAIQTAHNTNLAVGYPRHANPWGPAALVLG